MSGPVSARSHELLTGPVGPRLTKMAIPTALGIGSILLFQTVDTFYVGQLGPRPLAAMSFTFPVVFVVMSLTMGIGVGATAAISRALGEGDRDRVRRITTDALALALILVVTVAAIGLFTIDPIFRAMGAAPDMIPLISSYMTTWYFGVAVLVIPMVGNSAIRATGDTKTPGIIMGIAGGVNVVLDPLFIFGIGPFPALGLQGAAIATVIAWSVTFLAALWILARRERMLAFDLPRISAVLQSWREILFVGLPAAATNVLVPVATAVLTRFVSAHGENAVAAFGVGSRLESIALIGSFALATSATPFVGQNFGAGNCDRIRQALRFGMKASLVYSLGVAAVLAIFARPIVGIFSDSAEVVDVAVDYLRIIPVTYGAFGVSIFVNSIFNAVGKPLHSAVVILVRLFVFSIPLAYFGSKYSGLFGLFVAMAAANVGIGLVATIMVRRHLVVVEAELEREGPSYAGASA